MSRAVPVRALHVNDAAFTTTTLLAEARSRGLPWSYLPLGQTDPRWMGVERIVRRGLRGLLWEGGLAAAAARSDLLHVHVATVVRHTRWVPRPYVLHVHGTDVRSHQYSPRYGNLVERALAGASAVLYSTPDLAHHVARRDAVMLPVPIATHQLPARTLATTPTVVFASRWSEVKGLEVQLAAAERLRRGLGPHARLLGLDWGEGAERARAAGVELVAKVDRVAFLKLLASAHVVIGQPTGMLAASELEALGIGVPVVSPLHPSWYDSIARPPVVGGIHLAERFRLPPQDPATADSPHLSGAEASSLGDAIAELALRELERTDPAGEQTRREWVRVEHGVERAVDILLDLYDRVMAGRRA